jgi:hypothetical protein
MRFDLPEPFGPIRTLRFYRSIIVGSSPNDSRFRIVRLRMTGSNGMSDRSNHSASRSEPVQIVEDRNFDFSCKALRREPHGHNVLEHT